MEPIELYPSDTNKKRGLIGSGALFFLAYQAMTWSSGDVEPVLMWIFLGLGLASLVPVARSYLAPRPSFAADAEGFSVMGKPKRPWDEFRGAEVRTLSYGFVPISRSVVVKVGKSILGGRIQIHPAQMSGPAAEMAADIQRYGQFMKTTERMMQSTEWASNTAGQAERAERPAAPAPQPRPERVSKPRGVSQAPDQALASAMRGGAGSGPIRSVPSLRERVFGRGTL